MRILGRQRRAVTQHVLAACVLCSVAWLAGVSPRAAEAQPSRAVRGSGVRVEAVPKRAASPAARVHALQLAQEHALLAEGAGPAVAPAVGDDEKADTGAATAAQAVSGTSRNTDEASVGIGEVIVTARKMHESSLKVPVVETIVSAQRLEQLQVTEIADLPTIVPGLNVGQVQTLGAQVAIRGVGSVAISPFVDQSVALNIDGVLMGSGQAFEMGLFDIGQIEVLKGPQSLFYGKSTTAGVISIHTADPTSKPEVIGRAEYEEEANTWREEAILSGPVSDTLELRLATQYTTSDGYFRNGTTAVLPGTGAALPLFNHAPDSDNGKARLTALWVPSDRFSARFKANYMQNRATDATPAEYTDCPGGTSGVPPTNIPFIGGNNTCRLGQTFYVVALDPRAFPGVVNDGHPFDDTYMEFGSLDLTYDPVQHLAINSTTGCYSISDRSLVNTANTTYAGTPLAGEGDFHRHSLTEEARVTSQFSTPLNFMLGIFYEDGLLSDSGPALGNIDLHLPAVLQNIANTIDIKTYSAFGQVRYKVVPQLELAAGARWSDERRTQDPFNLLTGLYVPGQKLSIHSNKLMPEFTITYTPTDDLTVYGAYKTGYKSGSFGSVVAFGDNSFADEEAKGGDLGIKSILLDRQLALNAASYLYDYSGLQVGVVNLVNGLVVNRVVNAGAARTYGIDIDAAFRPAGIEGLQLNGALNWNHARYTRLDNVPCWAGQTIAEGCDQDLTPATGLYAAQNLSGTPMVRAPAWQLNFGFNYQMPIADGYRLVLSNSNSYLSRFVTGLAVGLPNEGQYQRGYTKVDLGVELVSPTDLWSIAVTGRNITDKVVAGSCAFTNVRAGVVFPGEITGGTTSGVAGPAQVTCFAEPGREVWLRLTLRPFARRD